MKNKFTIPLDRVDAALWVYELSILTFIITILRIPYNAAIISHEKMNIYAYLSLTEVVLKLGIVFILSWYQFDKLILYAALTLVVSFIVTIVYGVFATRKFCECRLVLFWDIVLFKKLVSYSGWNLFGALAGVFNNQGSNIILNVFFGPVVNAARAISFQVNSAINQFVHSFMTATRPQIIKHYAANNTSQMMKLIFMSSKISFILLFVMSMPVLLETEFVFKLWLKELPEYVVLFTRLMILSSLVDSLSYPLQTGAQATGKIKVYQAVVGGAMILNLPISYVFLLRGSNPEMIFVLAIFNSLVCLVLRLVLLRNMIALNIRRYLHNVLLPLLLVSFLSYLPPYGVKIWLADYEYRFFLVSICSFLSSMITIYMLGLNYIEKQELINLKENLYKKK